MGFEGLCKLAVDERLQRAVFKQRNPQTLAAGINEHILGLGLGHNGRSARLLLRNLSLLQSVYLRKCNDH